MNITIQLPDDEQTCKDLIDSALYGVSLLRREGDEEEARAIEQLIERIQERLR